jgi:hypothetical protein
MSFRTREIPYIYCDRPQEDEILSSWFDRNIQRYGLTRESLMQVLGISPSVTWDYDTFDFWEARSRVFECLGMRWTDLRSFATSPLEAQWMVQSRHRTSYCPRCFKEDLDAQRTPYFRKAWSNLLTTHCERHTSPLFRWFGCNHQGTRTLPKEWLKATDFRRFVSGSGVSSGIAAMTFDQQLTEIDALEKNLKKDRHSNEVWVTLTNFEAAWARYMVDAVGHCSVDANETDIGKVCRVLILVLERYTHRSTKRMIADELCPFFYSKEYIDFDPRDVRISLQRSRAWHNTIRTLSNIRTRRAALWCVAHTVSSLSPKTKLRNGTYSAPGKSMGWYMAMADAIGNQDAVALATQTQASRHLLEPIAYSSIDGPPHHYWKSEALAEY